MNVLLYCRVSSDEQRENTSLGYQESKMREYCQRHGYEVVGCYYEDFTAKHHDLRRPQMRVLYNYCKRNKGQINMLLFLRWDRFSRNTEFAFTYIRKFKELGVTINSVETSIDFKSPDWSTLIGVYCGNAQAEDTKISKRTRDGIRANLLRGHWTNKAPRGYKNVRTGKNSGETHIEIDVAKAKEVSRMFSEVAKGIESPYIIRRRMFSHLSESTFFDMLRNVFYIGKIRVPAYNDEPEQIVEGEHEAIVDEVTFQKVQDIIDGRRRKSPKRSQTDKPDLFLRKFLVCPICGHAITGATSRGNGGRYTYYFCSDTQKHVRLRAEDVNEGFARYVSCLTPKKEVLALYNEVLKDVCGESKQERMKEVRKLREEKEHLTAKVEEADDMLMDGKLAQSDHTRITQRLIKRIEEAETRITLLETENRGNIEPKLNYSISLIDKIEDIVRFAPMDVKIRVLGSMFPQKIEFDGKNYRTNEFNKVLDLIYHETNKLRGDENEKAEENLNSSASVPRAGVEPARVAPLVFETSASTDSAIWALRVQRYKEK